MTYIKKAVRHRARQAGFKRIETPIFENREVFERGIGEHTDAVEKELFLVSGKHTEDGEPSYALRPETTAATCRAYIEHGIQQWPQPVQLYNFGPSFRYDRPQKGPLADLASSLRSRPTPEASGTAGDPRHSA